MSKAVRNFTEDRRLTGSERAAIRREVVQWWLAEEPGEEGVRHAYRYDVEQLADGSRVYLTRPTRLNKGMDFVIKCEKYVYFKNGNDRPPQHLDVMAELLAVAPEGGARREALMELIRRVWACEPPDDALSSAPGFAGDLRVERSLKLLRWFFIEQDLTYWTDSGRWMLLRALELHLSAGAPSPK
jgi:hypothetical protein